MISRVMFYLNQNKPSVLDAVNLCAALCRERGIETVFFESAPRLLSLSRDAVKKLGLRNVYFGRMVTGEAFITDEGRGRILEKYSPLSVDMETAGIAHVCYVNGIPFLSIRCITDTAEHSGNETFHANCARASEIAAELGVSQVQVSRMEKRILKKLKEKI